MTKDNKKERQYERYFTRREFIKSTAIGATTVYLAPSFAFGTDRNFKSRVVNIHHAKLITSDDQIHARYARQSVDEALLLLTQKTDIKDAWMEIFPDLKTKDTIGLKVNAVNRKCPTHPQIAYAIADSMIDSFGMNPNNIILWDQTSSELKKCGYAVNKSNKGIRCFGTVDKFSASRWLLNRKQDETGGIGHDKSQPVDVGDGKTSHLSKILTRMCTYLINVPVLKDHGRAGITLSLKNHYGSFDNPKECHSNFCNPFVARINATPHIRNKTKLIICDAAFGIYKGGPLGAPQFKNSAILASTDPVALDYTGLQIINAQRKKHGLDMVTEKAVHIKTAQTLGLGTCSPDKILLKESVLS